MAAWQCLACKQLYGAVLRFLCSSILTSYSISLNVTTLLVLFFKDCPRSCWHLVLFRPGYGVTYKAHRHRWNRQNWKVGRVEKCWLNKHDHVISFSRVALLLLASDQWALLHRHPDANLIFLLLPRISCFHGSLSRLQQRIEKNTGLSELNYVYKAKTITGCIG